MMDEPESGELWTNDESENIVKVLGQLPTEGRLTDNHANIITVQNPDRTASAWCLRDFLDMHTYRAGAHE